MKLFSLDYGVPFIGDINNFATVFYGLFIAFVFDMFLFKKGFALENLGSKLGFNEFTFWMTFIIINIVLFYSSASNFIYFQF